VIVAVLRECFKLDGIKQLTERKHCAFIERLLDNHGLSKLLLMYAQNSIGYFSKFLGVCMCFLVFGVFFVCYCVNCVLCLMPLRRNKDIN